MSGITLSASVRSNLLSLQNTAALLDTTQTRLATGNKVNSALDNPTSYFTAQSLNSRASDLGNLLDSVGNAIQTIQAANDGITSITKLVDSAKATANQAQQLAATVDVAATSGSVTGTGFTNLDVSGGSDAISFTVKVDAGSAQTVNIDSTHITAYNTAKSASLSASALTATDVAALINYQTSSTVASVSGGNIKLDSTTTGTSSQVVIGTITSTVTGGTLGLTAGTTAGAAASTGRYRR